MHVGLKVFTPSRCVTHLSWVVFIGSMLEHFSNHLNSLLLLLYEHLRSKKDEFYHIKKDEFYHSKKSAVRVFGEVWPALTLVNAWSNWDEFFRRLWSKQDLIFGTKIEVKEWPKVELRWLLVLLPYVEFSVQRWIFWGWLLSSPCDYFKESCDTCWVGWLWSLCWLKHPVDRRNAPSPLSVSDLSSKGSLVCSICILLVNSCDCYW